MDNNNSENKSDQSDMDILRLKLIEKGMDKQNKMIQKWLIDYETTKTWRQLKAGLLTHNFQADLKKLVRVEACDIDDKNQKTYFMPFDRKQKIILCYNKIANYQEFQHELTYNIILAYDSWKKVNFNWNDVKQVGSTVLRGVHIADICKRDNKTCFSNELKKRVFSKQRFLYKDYLFQQIYEKSINNLDPITSLKFA